jgi:diguanylate cyclase (GGDEF)-like protein
VVLNLDRLHHVNDTLGYAVGDQVLAEAARRLRALAGDAAGSVGRIAGDEFLLLTRTAEGVEGFEKLAREAARVLAQPYVIGAQTVYLTCSVGVSWFPESGSDSAQLLGQADLALNIAKQQGRNRVVLYSAERSADMAQRIVVGAEMREALQRDEIRLHYQPLVDAAAGGIAGAEALMRWNNARLGSVSPGRFIPVAEDTGMIIRLGDYALRTAIAQLRAWDAEGRRSVPVSVNVSAWQFQRPEFIAEIEQALRDAGVRPGLLKLELTESTVMEDAQAAVRKFEGLKRLGVRISLDDFGTGYSSLGYLRKLPIDEVKIDQSFVRDITTDSYAATLCRAIIAMSQQLHFTVVAEGVETPAQAQLLRESGCQLLQGFLYSKAVPVADFGRMLARGTRWSTEGQPVG